MPLKRSNALVQLSREHHFALLLCWKIRKGIRNKVKISRIHNYAIWFYKNHLNPHFTIEENSLFPILGFEHTLIKKAIEQHQTLAFLFENEAKSETTLTKIADKLEEHVRFEEREVFEEIQKQSNLEQLENLLKNHTNTEFVENLEDKFWE